MKNMLVKDTFRDIKKSRGRFISIFAIVALGVAFFAGIKQAPINMKVTADKYYDDYNLMDIRLVSTLGLTKEDEEAVKNIDGVLGAHATKAMDVLTTADSVEVVLKVHGLPTENLSDSNEDYINRANVVEGRLPEKSGECVIESGKLASLDVEIGSKIVLSSGTNTDITESLQQKEYTVVGKVQTPYYLSFEKGSSTIGSGKVGSFIMIPESDFKSDVYTDIYLTVDGAKELNSYKNKYFDVVNKVTDKLEDLGKDRAALRYEEIHTKALEEFNKGKEKFEEERKKVLDALNEGKEKINQGKIDLDNGQRELESRQVEFKNFVATSEAQIKSADIELANGEKEYSDGLKKFNEEKPKAEEEIKKGEEQIAQGESALVYLKEAKKYAEDKLNDPNTSVAEKEILERAVSELTKIISDTEIKIQEGKKQVEAGRKALVDAENNLIEARRKLDEGKVTLEDNKVKLEAGKVKANNEFTKAQNDINLGKEGLQKAEEEIKKQEEVANEQLSIAEGKLKDAENALKTIADCEWIVLDRNKHYSYVDYKSSADSIDKLAKIFPVFFFLVAALVCLTTMTRMVDEQRTNIGTLKALGYSKGAIAFKFIVYALIASLGGSVVGLAIGLTVFPMVVFNAYSIMYVLPQMTMGVDLVISLGITLIAVGITTLAAMSACYKELVETPSILMRPKAPKNGKRILIERIPFLWNKFSFTGKVTVRNLFRYKKRFFMTVFGIAGCTALILTGFGIKDSIKTIVSEQFTTINKYEMTVTLDKDLSIEDKQSIIDRINSNSEIEMSERIWSENSKIINGDIEKEATIMVPKSLDNFEDFITLQSRQKKESIELDNSGVVISEKLAKLLKVKVGDTITIRNNKNVKAEFKITGVTENYTFHYIYIAPELYEEKFNTKLEYSTIVAKLKDKAKEAENRISQEIMNIDGVSGVAFNSGIRDSFDDTMKSLNYVVLVLIVSAGGLAFVVLYNLTNVNISERIREIATIKVLGFYDNEVSAYIYRENIILTVIGTLVGLGLGVVLHRFIMVTVEMENLMFGRVINLPSYCISAFLTIFFAILVNVAMYYKLKNVEMVESLKSVD